MDRGEWKLSLSLTLSYTLARLLSQLLVLFLTSSLSPFRTIVHTHSLSLNTHLLSIYICSPTTTPIEGVIDAPKLSRRNE